jgi:two-component system nitrate/nitrite response regulator NarL
MADLRILIIANDPLARAGLAALLAEQPGIAVVGRISAADDLHGAVETCLPDVLLWDFGWQREASIDALSSFAELGVPGLALLPDEVSPGAAWSAGLRALLRRDADPSRIVAAVEAVWLGLTVVDPAFHSALFNMSDPFPLQPGGVRAPEQPVEELTPRERQVLRLMAEGLPNKNIAARLGISEHTVKFHINAILGKLGAGSRTDAVVRATRLGLILL